MSPKPSAPVVYHWPFIKVLVPFLPLAVVLPFLLLKPNRQPKAWLMLIPFGLIGAIALMVRIPWMTRLTLLGAGFSEQYPWIVALASSLCVIGLMSYAVPTWSFARKLVAIPALFVLPAAVVLFLVQGYGDIRIWATPLTFALVPLIVLASFVLAGRRSRKSWKLMRFSQWFFGWTLLLLFAFVLFSVGYRYRTILLRTWRWQYPLQSGGTVLLIIAAVVLAVAIPFILTAFLSPFYRDRLKAAFNVVPAPQPEQSPSAEPPIPPSAAG